MPEIKHTKEILYCGRKQITGCDGKCQKAWGMNSRPTRELSTTDINDYIFEKDSVLERAPNDPGTSEGDHGKPWGDQHIKLNKWCVRECERSATVPVGEDLIIPDLENPEPNILARRRTVTIHRRIVPIAVELLLPPHPIEFIEYDSDEGRSCLACGFSVPSGFRHHHKRWCETIGRRLNRGR